jgi:hypothetical protein
MPSCLNNNNGSFRNYGHQDLRGSKFGNAEIVFNRRSRLADNAWSIMREAQSISLLKLGGSGDEFFSPTLTHVLNGNIGSTFCEMQDPEGQLLYVYPSMVTTKDLKGKSRDIRLSKEMIDPEVQDVISGVCLFGASSVTVSAENGRKYHLVDPDEMETIDSPITEIEEKNDRHPYEIEAASRLTGFLNFVNTKELNVSFHVPRLEYWLYGLQLYEKGLMSNKLLQQWFSTVNKRSERMKDLLRENLPSNAKAPDFIEPLSGIEHMLQKDMEEGESPLRRMVEHLYSKDEIWRKILDTSDTLALREKADAQRRREKELPEKRPKYKLKSELNAFDLTCLSYVVAYAKKLDVSKGLLLALENPEEVKILEQAKQLIRTPDAKSILGLYPHPNFIVPKEKAFGDKHDLFYYNDQEFNSNHSTVIDIYPN